MKTEILDMVLAMDTPRDKMAGYQKRPWFKGHANFFPKNPKGMAANFNIGFNVDRHHAIEDLDNMFISLFEDRVNLLESTINKLRSTILHYADAKGYLKVGYANEITQEEIDQMIDMMDSYHLEIDFLNELKETVRPFFKDVIQKLQNMDMRD